MIFKIRIVGCVFFLLFTLAWKTGVTNGKDTLKLCIVTHAVNLKLDGRSLVIPVTLENRSKIDYVFYAFEKASILDTSMDSIFFADVITNGGAGTLAIVLDKMGNRQQVFFNIESHNEELKDDLGNADLESIEKLGKALYVNGAILVKSRKRKEVNLRISMKNVTLEKGEYQLKILYYAGQGLRDVVGLAQLGEKEKTLEATTFFGSIESNIIRLKLD